MELVGGNGKPLTKPAGPRFRVAVCVPTRGRVCWGFAYDLAQMMCYTGTSVVSREIMEIGMIFADGTYIASNREDLVDQAMKSEPTHILWLDDDMRFPQDTLLRLLQRNREVVGANYATRGTPCVAVAIKKASDTKGRLLTMPDSTGLERVETLGFGVTLVQASVFRRIPKPWFENYWSPKLERRVGEDVDFCRKCAAHDVKIFVDHDLSKEVGHMGEFEYRLEHAQAYAEEFGGEDGPQETESLQRGRPAKQAEPLHQGSGPTGRPEIRLRDEE